MKLEAALLTGGRVSRMSFHSSDYLVEGEPLGLRMARMLSSVTERVTVIGGKPVVGHGFLDDVGGSRGPLTALARFQPLAAMVVVASCNMPAFQPQIVPFLVQRMEADQSANAIVPVIGGYPLPLCAVYRSEAFSLIQTVVAEGRQNLMAWLDMLWVERVEEAELDAAGINPKWLIPAHTPEEFARSVAIL